MTFTVDWALKNDYLSWFFVDCFTGMGIWCENPTIWKSLGFFVQAQNLFLSPRMRFSWRKWEKFVSFGPQTRGLAPQSDQRPTATPDPHSVLREFHHFPFPSLLQPLGAWRDPTLLSLSVSRGHLALFCLKSHFVCVGIYFIPFIVGLCEGERTGHGNRVGLFVYMSGQAWLKFDCAVIQVPLDIELLNDCLGLHTGCTVSSQ